MIQNLITGFSVSTVIETLGLSRSTYYAQINRKKSKTQVEQERLAFQIHKEYQNAKGRYGASKIHQKLIQSSNNCSLKRVQRLMRKMGLQANTRKKWKPKTPDSSDRKHLSNLLKQDFIASRLNEKWSTDITYIHTVKDEWCYLSSIMDLYSKKIIAWDFSKTMEKELVLQTIEKVAYRVNDSLILQTDKAVNIF